MTSIILMIIGVVVFGIGLFLFLQSENSDKPEKSTEDLNKIVEMAIADGVLTSNERSFIKKIAKEKELDYDRIIIDIEEQIALSDVESETALIDYNKKHGDDFEKFVVKKFNKDFFTIKEWAGDKYVDGSYAETTPQPDLLMEFRIQENSSRFAVECKWRKNLYKNGIIFASREQLNRYKNYGEKNEIPVFLAIGMGGKGISPEKLYVIPLKDIDKNYIHKSKLSRYEKDIENNFFYDYKTKKLK